MKKLWTVIFVFLQTVCFAQVTVLPGDKSINTFLLKPGTYTMAYTINYNNKWVPLGQYFTELTFVKNQLKVNTSLSFTKTNIQWTENFVADANSFLPLSSYSDRDERTLSLSFSNRITGFFLDKKSKKKKLINEDLPKNCFDVSVYPYIIQMLPLDVGYRAIMPIFDYEATDKAKTHHIEIIEVKSDVHTSHLTGEHKVWKVAVLEGNTGHRFDYFIDKANRRIWKINIVSAKGDKIAMTNIEADFNPFKAPFDKKTTFAMVQNGSAVIKGTAFARDNENEGGLKGMAVLNINKKQYAAKGTEIVLIPYTAYFKEWISRNEKQHEIKNAKPIPLPKDAFDCFKRTTVYDDDGNFEFTNLKPGEYLLVTAFGYKHTSRQTEETGRASVIVNGTYQGDEVYTSVFSYSSNSTANIQKVVSIKKEGEKVEVKLKKTL
ncbi:carboxypeptidase-like regulatory domain-containing protein [Pedobacter sp. Du54]|uniref:carboxypeptidase-like regulatory domain-containing protein n=1 Tax=Pedobacter anseongensis TaxID=3133439 RepID=UPI00309E71C0